MPSPLTQLGVDARASSEAEQLALAYLQAAQGDRWTALVQLAQDAVSDLTRAEARIREREALISRGYVRAGVER